MNWITCHVPWSCHLEVSPPPPPPPYMLSMQLRLTLLSHYIYIIYYIMCLLYAVGHVSNNKTCNGLFAIWRMKLFVYIKTGNYNSFIRTVWRVSNNITGYDNCFLSEVLCFCGDNIYIGYSFKIIKVGVSFSARDSWKK